MWSMFDRFLPLKYSLTFRKRLFSAHLVFCYLGTLLLWPNPKNPTELLAQAA
jgi:hypothetical protein